MGLFDLFSKKQKNANQSFLAEQRGQQAIAKINKLALPERLKKQMIDAGVFDIWFNDEDLAPLAAAIKDEEIIQYAAIGINEHSENVMLVCSNRNLIILKKKRSDEPQIIDLKQVKSVILKNQLMYGELSLIVGNRSLDINSINKVPAEILADNIKKWSKIAQGEDDDFDQDLFGEYSGAGVIFGASGGVMEAALRTVADILAHEDLSMIDYHAVRGVEGVKESTIKIGEQTLKVAVAQSMTLAKPLLDDIRNGVSPYHFIEIMGCPGGCINGGGQPYVNATIRNSGFNFKQARAKALYDEDISLPVRKSHKNSQIQNLYKNYLGEPNSEKAHHLLHTHYTKKARFK